MAAARRLTRHNFYEALLAQDGHEIEHVRPPRDLQTWQQLPISAIANFKPVTIKDLSDGELQKTLQAHPYKRFPVVIEAVFKGFLKRDEAEAATREKRPPQLINPAFCLPNQTIRDLQFILIESAAGMAVLLDRPEGNVLGLVTLHDLLRAQVSIAKNDEV